MINIVPLDSASFSIEGAVLPKVFDATLNRFNDVILRNIKTGYRINLGDILEITLDGYVTTLSEIKDVVYNHSCNCDPPIYPPVFKIFDVTIDTTFN